MRLSQSDLLSACLQNTSNHRLCMHANDKMTSSNRLTQVPMKCITYTVAKTVDPYYIEDPEPELTSRVSEFTFLIGGIPTFMPASSLSSATIMSSFPSGIFPPC